MASSFKIGDFELGHFLAPYVIAEIGVNHEGDIELAKEMIDTAAEAGAHAAKFQTYKADKIASKNSPAYWELEKEPTDSQHKLFQKYDQFGELEYAELAAHCAQREVDFLSTPFDLDAVDFLDSLVPAYKIASADITNVPLIRRCASKGKPIIMSTGAATLPEIEFAVEVARGAGAECISLLHCVLNYPTPPNHAQLGTIKSLERIFPNCVIGYSDHVTPGSEMPAMEAALLFGATVLEKHYTYDKTLPGNDHYHAMNSDDLSRFMRKVEQYQLMAPATDKTMDNELAARLHARRSIVAARTLRAGEQLTEDCLIAKRPGHGISPIHWDEVIGCTILQDVKEDTLLTWNVLSPTGVDGQSGR